MTDLAGWAQVGVIILTLALAIIAAFWKIHADQRKQDYAIHLRINELKDEVHDMRVENLELMSEHNKENSTWREMVEGRLSHVEARTNGKPVSKN